jgi:hypothetical protein
MEPPEAPRDKSKRGSRFHPRALQSIPMARFPKLIGSRFRVQRL